MKDEISEIIEDEEKSEKLNKLIEQKVEEKIESKLKQKKKEEEKGQKEEVSRRGFMKKIGAGALGLGALSISPVSAYDIKSSHGLEVWSEGNQHMEVYNGEVDFLNNNLTGVNQINGQNADNLGVTDHSNLSNVKSDQHHPQFTAGDARTAINNDNDHGSTAPHNYFSEDYNDLTNVPSSFNPENHGNSSHTTDYLPSSDYNPETDTHSKYTDGEAQDALHRHSFRYSTSNTGTTWFKVGEITDGGGSLHIRVTDMESYGNSSDDTWMVAKAQAGNGTGEFGGHYYQIGRQNRGGGVEYVNQSSYAEIYVRLGSYARGTIHVTANPSGTVSFNTTTNDPGGTELEEALPIQSKISENGNRVATRNWVKDNASSVEASETDDGSDITEYSGGGTFCDINGSGVLLGGMAFQGGDGESVKVTITVDGGTSFDIDQYFSWDDTGYGAVVVSIPPVRFEDSLTLSTNGQGAHVTVKR